MVAAIHVRVRVGTARDADCTGNAREGTHAGGDGAETVTMLFHPPSARFTPRRRAFVDEIPRRGDRNTPNPRESLVVWKGGTEGEDIVSGLSARGIWKPAGTTVPVGRFANSSQAGCTSVHITAADGVQTAPGSDIRLTPAASIARREAGAQEHSYPGTHVQGGATDWKTRHLLPSGDQFLCVLPPVGSPCRRCRFEWTRSGWRFSASAISQRPAVDPEAPQRQKPAIPPATSMNAEPVVGPSGDTLTRIGALTSTSDARGHDRGRVEAHFKLSSHTSR